jgi:hypothetical protein
METENTRCDTGRTETRTYVLENLLRRIFGNNNKDTIGGWRML